MSFTASATAACSAVQLQAELAKLREEHAKQAHRNQLLELKAPQAGKVKDVATHTAGAVVSPGTILMSLVPTNEPLQAEVFIKNEDVGFVKEGQQVKIKLAAYPFQKYGVIEGRVVHLGVDAAEAAQTPNANAVREHEPSALALPYRAIIQLDTQGLTAQNHHFELTPGMQVITEMHQGERTVLEYLLSPVQGTLQEAARER
jgi:hemolysin D